MKNEVSDAEFMAQMNEETAFMNRSSRRASRIQIPKGHTWRVRFVPFKFPNGLYYARIAFHWINKKPTLCITNTETRLGGDPDYKCPVCAVAERLNESSDKKVSNAGYWAQSNPQWLAMALPFGKDDGSGEEATRGEERWTPAEFWMHRTTAVDFISMYKRDFQRNGPTSFMDFVKGRDIWVTVKNKGGMKLERDDPQPFANQDDKDRFDALCTKVLETVKWKMNEIPTDDDLDEVAEKLEESVVGRGGRGGDDRDDRRGGGRDYDDRRGSQDRRGDDDEPRSRRTSRSEPDDDPPRRGRAVDDEPPRTSSRRATPDDRGGDDDRRRSTRAADDRGGDQDGPGDDRGDDHGGDDRRRDDPPPRRGDDRRRPEPESRGDDRDRGGDDRRAGDRGGDRGGDRRATVDTDGSDFSPLRQAASPPPARRASPPPAARSAEPPPSRASNGPVASSLDPDDNVAPEGRDPAPPADSLPPIDESDSGHGAPPPAVDTKATGLSNRLRTSIQRASRTA